MNCDCYKTGDDWKMNSLLRRRKSRDILRYTFRITIRYKFFVYCNIPLYRYIVTPLAPILISSKQKWGHLLYLTWRISRIIGNFFNENWCHCRLILYVLFGKDPGAIFKSLDDFFRLTKDRLPFQRREVIYLKVIRNTNSAQLIGGSSDLITFGFKLLHGLQFHLLKGNRVIWADW